MRTHTTRSVHLAWAAVGLLLASAPAGCRNSPSRTAAPATERATRPAASRSAADLPDIPGMEDSPAGATEIIVRSDPATRPAKPVYQMDDRCPAGTLVGAVKFKGRLDRAKAARPTPVDVSAGESAIPNPEPGEVDYYRNLKPVEPTYVEPSSLRPQGTVLILRGIKSGRRPIMGRAVFMIREGRFAPHIQFGPADERVMFGTYDTFPTDMVMTRQSDGRVVMRENISAFDRDTIKPLGGGGVHYTRRPAMQQSEVLEGLDGYSITSPRHRWKTAYVFTVDSPYAVVVDDRDGRFSLEGVPVGAWTVDVWHPRFQPVKATCEVTIQLDQPTELAVELLVPPELAETPASAPAAKPGG